MAEVPAPEAQAQEERALFLRLKGKVFKTAQAAKILRVSQQTIIRIFDNGLLKGFRVPGSTHRRILGEHIFKYCKETKTLDCIDFPANGDENITVASDEIRANVSAVASGAKHG